MLNRHDKCLLIIQKYLKKEQLEITIFDIVRCLYIHRHRGYEGAEAIDHRILTTCDKVHSKFECILTMEADRLLPIEPSIADPPITDMIRHINVLSDMDRERLILEFI